MPNTQAHEEIVSRPHRLKFIKTEIGSYAGLNFEDAPDKCMVIMFPENERILQASCDQGGGKTSLLKAFKSTMGMEEPDNAINQSTGSKSVTHEFMVSDKEYRVRITSKGFTVSLASEINGNKRYADLKSPKSMLSELIGPIGMSPSFLSSKKSGKDQIEWIKSLTVNGDAKNAEEELNQKYSKAYNDRTGINKEFERLKSDLLNTGYFVWDNDNKEMRESGKRVEDAEMVKSFPNSKQIEENFQQAVKDRDTLTITRQKLNQYEDSKRKTQEDITSLENKILELQNQIQTKKSAIIEIDESIRKGKEFEQNLLGAEDNFRKSQEEMQKASNVALVKRSLEDAAVKYDFFTQTEQARETINNFMVEIEAQIKQMAKDCTPDIEGLEVVIGNIDSQKPEGVYLNGVNMAHLSESEQWDLCLQLWKLMGVSVVFIENITSLGSSAIERVNWFAENGGYVFVSCLNRGYKELHVDFLTQLQ